MGMGVGMGVGELGMGTGIGVGNGYGYVYGYWMWVWMLERGINKDVRALWQVCMRIKNTSVNPSRNATEVS